MIDNFALALIHGLLALAGWRLLQREDLDADPADAVRPGKRSEGGDSPHG
jgi:hypothetical protein